MKPLEERGYIIPAFNIDPKIDYVDCARTLAKTLLMHHPDARICLLTNEQVGPDFLFAHTRVVKDINTDNPWANDCLVFNQTPFRQTIKLEADMLVAGAVDHWWTLFEHRDVAISQGCRNFHDQPGTSRYYRKLFDANNLPDVYNAVTYWRLSQTAQEFFRTVQNIFANWTQYRTLLKFPEELPSTDVVYAMAAVIVGPERVLLPQGLGPTIVHMKQHINNLNTEKWTNELVWEMNPLRINTVAQWGFFHYHVKDWR